MMDNSYSDIGSPPGTGQNELPGNHVVIQQYARYPASRDPTIHNHSPPGNSQVHRADPVPSPSLNRGGSRSLQPSPRDFRSGILAPAKSQSATSVSPAFTTATQERQAEAPTAELRSLPPRDISDATIDDAYVDFIFYCNPDISSSTDTTELRRIFRSPPRSEGKSFSIFTLWELIQKLDRKELKTWIQLAMELGVEPPSVEKKQSTQKVQQYAVRLKRWMRAMHVDAFFEYCLGHQHSYYTQLRSSGELNADSRDGVPREEDLALRALFPEWKPKKGRRRGDGKDIEDPKNVKRPHLDTPSVNLGNNGFSYHPDAFPNSAMPWSAFPDDIEQPDPWATAAALTATTHSENQTLTPQQLLGRGQDLRWRLSGRETSPGMQYPQSAIIPRFRDSDALFQSEPRSAITPASPDKVPSRRRRGPAVSSAWPTVANSSTGKVRGRPATHRTTQNGPFSTFPANPKTAEFSTPNPGQGGSENSLIGRDEPKALMSASPCTSQSTSAFQPLNSRPAKLQLQVPENSGRPVRLATPPVVLVNGENNNLTSPYEPNERQRSDLLNDQEDSDNDACVPSYDQQDRNLAINFCLDDVANTFSTQIYHARLVNRTVPLTIEEARKIADRAVQQIKLNCPDRLPINALAIYCAVCLGVGHQLGLGGKPPGKATLKVSPDTLATSSREAIPAAATNSRSNGTGMQQLPEAKYTLSYDSFPASGITVSTLIQNCAPSLADQYSQHQKECDNVDNSTKNHTKPSYLVHDDGSDDELLDEHASETVWKQRYMNLRKQIRKRDTAMGKYKRKILEAVMADI